MNGCANCGAEIKHIEHVHAETGAIYCDDCWEDVE